MINYIYQLVSPGVISVKYEDIEFSDKVIVKPTHMALCHADCRYYFGKRSVEKLKLKLPMALIHEAVGEVVYDPTKTYDVGHKVAMIPNVLSDDHVDGFYENYEKGSSFLSSGKDGFMREFVNLPVDRIVPFSNVSPNFAAICEFISVGVHAVERLMACSHCKRERIGIWGDGSLAYIVACILKKSMPESKIIVIGRDNYKLSQFLFVDETYFSDDIPDNFNVNHAVECAGGEGSYFAIDDIIKYINPQGTVVLMGVTENKVAINTRDILEKGLTFIGSSRSGRLDFVKAVEFLEDVWFQRRIARIIYEDEKVNRISDIHRVFKTDLNTPFKTVFEWNL